MDRLTRHDLKTDKFAAEVGHSLEYVAAHRRQAVRLGAAALILLVIGLGVYYYVKSQRAARQDALAAALRLKEGIIGPAPQAGDPRASFGSQLEKDNAVKKAFEEITKKYSGTNEASVAHYQLGSMAADAGNLEEAAKQFRAGVESGSGGYQAVSKLALAQTLEAQGKTADAEKLLRELIANPTTLVSKEQATFALVRMLAKTKPEEARKLLAPYEKDSRVAIARNAAALLAEIPAK